MVPLGLLFFVGQALTMGGLYGGPLYLAVVLGKRSPG